MQFDEVLGTFAGFFERERIRFALIGGLAMQALGHSRFTRDVDFVIGRESRDAVVAFAESLGYETLHVSEGYSNHLHPEKTFGRVDFMYVDLATAGALFPAAVTRPIVGAISMPVAHPNHLAAMKAMAMKNAPQRVLVDSPDVQYLLSLPETDRAVVRDWRRTVGSVRCDRQANLSRSISRRSGPQPRTSPRSSA